MPRNLVHPYFRRLLFALVLAALIFCTACAPKPVLSHRNIAHIEGVRGIVLAQPTVEHIDSSKNCRVKLDQKIKTDAESSIVASFYSRLGSNQIKISMSSDSSIAGQRTVKGLEEVYRLIKKRASSMDSRYYEQLSAIAKDTGASHIMFSRCRLYAGPSGYWNPYNGAIGHNSSRVVLEGLLYHLEEGKIEWERISQVRQKIENNSKCFETLIFELLTTLKIN